VKPVEKARKDVRALGKIEEKKAFYIPSWSPPSCNIEDSIGTNTDNGLRVGITNYKVREFARSQAERLFSFVSIPKKDIAKYLVSKPADVPAPPHTPAPLRAASPSPFEIQECANRFNKFQLVQIARENRLDTSGTKMEICARLTHANVALTAA
jgi:hypothetical protein